MYIDVVPNRASPPAVLLRESYREGGKVKKRTLANLSALPPEAIEAIRATLRGQTLLPCRTLAGPRRTPLPGSSAGFGTRVVDHGVRRRSNG